MTRKRKQDTAQEKVAMLRRHLVEKVPVSQLCDEARLQPTVFYMFWFSLKWRIAVAV